MAIFQRLRNSFNWTHAAAEVALIVVGILIALWADSWIGERRDAQRETARLTALHADTEQTLEAISLVHQEASDAANALRRILDLQPPYDFNPQTVSLLRHGLLFGLAFHPEMSVYDDLKNSGELALLTSPALREALSSMEAGLEQLQYFQADLTTVQQLNIDSYMIDHMDLMSFYGEMLGMQLSDDELRADLGFIADTEFRNRVLLKLDLVTQLEMVIATAESRVIAVKQNIEAELEQR